MPSSEGTDIIISDPVEGELINPLEPDGNLYAESHYLLFGAETCERYNETFDCRATKQYLRQMGIATDGALTQARRYKHKVADYLEGSADFERCCDFCGKALTGVEFDSLKDGRDRCVACSQTVVKSKESFEALFRQVQDGMKEKFGIDLPSRMKVEVVSTKKLARMAEREFSSTHGFDARAVGLAKRHKNGEYDIVFENGAPRISLISTSVHELTHLWQYSHWNCEEIESRYDGHSAAIYEGMAMWAQIQYLFLINERDHAELELQNGIARTDIYGYGLRLFLNQYPFSRGIVLEGDSPFTHPDAPLGGRQTEE